MSTVTSATTAPVTLGSAAIAAAVDAANRAAVAAWLPSVVAPSTPLLPCWVGSSVGTMHTCKRNSAPLRRRPCEKTDWYCFGVSSRAMRGKRAPANSRLAAAALSALGCCGMLNKSRGVCDKTRHLEWCRHHSIQRSDRETNATLRTAAGKNLATVGSGHAGTKSVVTLALDVAGLVRTLGGHGGAPDEICVEEPAILAVEAKPRQLLEGTVG